MQGYREWRVLARAEEAPGVETLRVAPCEGELPRFTPGQFVNALLPALGPESKSYSIANGTGAAAFLLTVRAIGTFSRALCALKEGERLHLSEPLGYFYPVDPARPRVFVAGGIGIVPFMSMLRTERGVAAAPTALLYSNRTLRDTVFAQELADLACERKNLAVRHFVTRASEPHATARRIGERDLTEARETHRDPDFFLCGSIAFVRDMRRTLKHAGVSEDVIFTESFF